MGDVEGLTDKQLLRFEAMLLGVEVENVVALMEMGHKLDEVTVAQAGSSYLTLRSFLLDSLPAGMDDDG